MSMNSTSALAATLGMTGSELREYVYQRGLKGRTVYAIGNKYFAVGKKQPDSDDGGYTWVRHSDQFWAQQCNTVIWKATV